MSTTDTPAPPRVGEELPVVTMTLTATSVVLQVSGTQDWHRIHHDADHARSGGHDSIFFNTGWTQGVLGRLVGDWIADRPWWLARLDYEMRQMNVPGDVVRASGEVVGVRTGADGVALFDLALRIENDRVGVTTKGSAVVRGRRPADGPGGER